MRHARAPDGTTIAYGVRGNGPRTLVFLHAWGASASYFDETIASLRPGAARAIAVDIRGHGASGKPDVEPTWEVLARDVFAVADDAGARTFVAVGHSMGGKLAQYLPLVDGARIEGLVLVASPSAGELLPIPDVVRGWVEHAGDGRALVDAAVRPFLRVPVAEDVLQRIGRDAAKIPRAYLERTLHLVSHTSFIERLSSVRAPVLVVSSEDDPLHATERDIVGSFSHARAETLPAGTEIPIERPAELARIIERFLDELDR